MKKIVTILFISFGFVYSNSFGLETSTQHLKGENYYGIVVSGEETDGTLFMINPHTKSYWILHNNAKGSTDYFKKENSTIVTKYINVLRVEKVGFKRRLYWRSSLC